MDRTPKRNAQEWRKIFSDWRKSGESQRAFCRREGMSISSFGYWHRKIKQDSEEQLIVKIDGFTPASSLIKNPITARAGRVMVDLSGYESEAILIRVFRALQAVS